MITLEAAYWLMGVLTLGIAVVNARDAGNPRRFNNAAFWGLYAVTFFAGSISRTSPQG
jgi:Predicted membrane protein